ncbi:MAG TPA: heparan-alpha-glucosaminide N-acetyltransferase domain-containing protein, partial [Polyangiales bacterium]|nr:heparan-alpha-glucosaminide N-acetyltransferase domain-containing protein [Polyangiales bacterium]
MSVDSRVVFVDLLRFVAALQMLQGHTIAALLAPAARHGPWFALWSAARGLTSVAFLFAAGLSFYLATERARDPRAASRRVLRALRLIALGYLLHLPLAALFTSDPASRLRALHEFAAVDVLQCIGVSLLALEALR